MSEQTATPYGTNARRTSVLGEWGARIVLIVVAACALVSVVFILVGTGGDTLGRVITTDVALIVFGLLVWLDTVIGRYRPEWFEFASLATDAYLLLLWIVTIWTGDASGFFWLWDAIWRGILCLIFVRGMLALVDLVRFLLRLWDVTATRVLAWIAACSFGAIGVLVTIPAPTPFNQLWDYELYGRIVAALAVIGGVALVLIPLWGLLMNRGRREAARQSYLAHSAGYPAAGQPYGYPPAPGVPGAPTPVAPAPAAQAPAAPPAPAISATAPAPAPGRPTLAWPRLADGRPVPAGADGAPDLSAVAGARLAWPVFLDGTPVPAGPDGGPLYR